MNSRFSVSQVIKDGAQKTFDCIGVLLKGLFFALLAVMLVTMGLAIANAGFLAAFWSLSPQLLAIQACGIDTACIQVFIQPFIQLFQGNVITLTFSLASLSIAFSYIALGFVNYTLHVYDKRTAGFSDLFPSLGRVIKIVIAFFLFGIMVSGGLVLLVIPGIYLMLRFGLFTYFILDKNVGIFDSLKMSWRITYGYCWELLALLLFALLLHAIGKITIVGWVFAIPMIYVTKAAVYRRLIIAHERNKDSAIN